MVEEVKTFGCPKCREAKAELPAHLPGGALKMGEWLITKGYWARSSQEV